MTTLKTVDKAVINHGCFSLNRPELSLTKIIVNGLLPTIVPKIIISLNQLLKELQHIRTVNFFWKITVSAFNKNNRKLASLKTIFPLSHFDNNDIRLIELAFCQTAKN